MMPPTISVLRSLLPFATVADVLAAAAGRSLEPIRPRLRSGVAGLYVELEDGTTVPLR